MAIEGVVTGIGGLAHEDGRRAIIEVFNNIPFSAKQVKIADINEQDAILGGHYHNYDELFFMIRGDARFILEDIDTKERGEYVLNRSSGGLLIPAKVAHLAKIRGNSILIGCTQEPHISPQDNDHPYEIKERKNIQKQKLRNILMTSLKILLIKPQKIFKRRDV